MGSDAGIVLSEDWEKLRRKLGPQLFGPPVRKMFTRAIWWGKGRIKTRAPRDVGNLARSFTSEVDNGVFPGWAEVKSSNPYARPMEYGAGLLSDAPDSSHRRFFPPGPALDGWASRHGFEDGWAVARIIYNQGGLHPHRFLRKTWQELKDKMPGYMREMRADIERIWAK